MSELQLFAVTGPGAQSLPVAEGATSLDDLYDGLPLGVYSVLRTFAHNKFLSLEEHLLRIERSMLLLGWDFQLDGEGLRRALHEVCTAYPLPDARVRLDVLAEPASMLDTDSRVLIGLMPFTPIPPSLYRKGVSVGFVPGLSRERPQAKTAEFTIRRRDYPKDHRGAYEYLLLDEMGRVLEGVSSNFYGVRDGAVWTAGTGVLAGVARKIILGLLPKLGIPQRLEAIRVDSIASLDEAAISSSSRGLLPVVEIEGQVIGDGRPGPICRRILTAYHEFVDGAIQTAV